MRSLLIPSNRTPTLPVPLTRTDSVSKVTGNGVINKYPEEQFPVPQFSLLFLVDIRNKYEQQ